MARLPSLNALRAFEAAARYLSFTRAAHELHVTQAAVSQQVRALEEDIGAPLFRRARRALVLTDAGRELAGDAAEAFARLADAAARARARGRTRPLAVSMTPSFGAKWLVPRLGRFLSAHPEIDLKIHTSQLLVDLRRGEADIVVRQGRGVYPGLSVELLAREDIFPVCSPKLIGRKPLETPNDLRAHVLLQDEGVEWGPWLAAAGVTGIDPDRGPRFLDSHLTLEACADGQGVALGRTMIAADDLASGRLVRPFPLSVTIPLAYWLVYAPDQAERPALQAFRQWILAEAAATLADFQARTAVSQP